MKYLVYILIASILFLITRRVLGRYYPNLKTSKNIISGVVALCLTPIISIAIFMLFFNILLYQYHPDREFTKDSWHQGIEDRHQMSDDLLESQILIGKTRKQIATDLGLPSDKIQVETDTSSNWRYKMGHRSWGFGLKFYYLNIEFENHMTKRVRVEEVMD